MMSRPLTRALISLRRRRYSHSRSLATQLKIGYVPGDSTFRASLTPSKQLTSINAKEHFSTPLYFAKKYFDLNASLIPFSSGTGHMIQSLKSSEIDVGIGLTEGWIAGLGNSAASKGYSLVGTYVETPLCWAISTGPRREFKNEEDLKGKKIGVSRVGSGSYVMSFVLADRKGWLNKEWGSPFEVVPLNNFANLREGVNIGSADFFMWEHFTSKRYYDNGEIKRIGEIYTPWSSWKIVARDKTDERLSAMFESIDKGISYFRDHQQEAVDYISTELDYSVEDSLAWLSTVRFAQNVKGVDPAVVGKTIDVLGKAGVLDVRGCRSASMIGLAR